MIAGFQTFLIDLQNCPNQVLFRHNQQQLCAKKFLSDLKKLSNGIAATSHQRWALCYQDSYAFIIAFFAVLACDREPILLPNNQSGTLKDLALEYDAILDDQSKLAAGSNPQPLLSLSPDLSVTFFTSGSSGRPKKISRSLQQLDNEIQALEQTFANALGDAPIYATVSHQHIYGLLFYLLWPLFAERVICQPLIVYPESFEKLAQSKQALNLITSPAFLKRLAGQKIATHGVSLFSSGGLLESASANAIYQRFGIYPYEVLGSTETGGVAYRQQNGDGFWQALPKVTLETNKQGCLTVSSPFFAGENAFIMGDCARFDANGRFQLLGRSDRIVKIEEKRVSLTEIEQRLKKHPMVKEVAALKMDKGRQYIALVVELSSIGQLELKTHGKRQVNETLKAALVNYVERLLLPRQFRYVEKMPCNTQGKRVLSDFEDLFR